MQNEFENCSNTMMQRCALDTAESIRMINCWVVIVIVCLTSSIFAEAVNVCSVQPTAAVVAVGERVLLNCNATGDVSISSWQIGTDATSKTVIYTAPLYGRNRSVARNQSLAVGYSVTNIADNKISLHMNKIQFSQAGLYVCGCGGQSLSTATTVVVVLASEPQFTVIPSIAISGKPVSFNCNISYSGSADISSNLTIKDVSGTTVSRAVCYSNNSLTFCVLNYTITANASVDQSHSCSVHMMANSSIIYSRLVNTSLNWKRVISAEIGVSNQSKCFAGKCTVSESITCRTEGSPGTISYKWWQIQYNGSKLDIGSGQQSLVLTTIGKFTYQCQVYSNIQGVFYNATSKNFTIVVTENDNSGPSPTVLVVIGISVAIGIVIVVIAIFVIRISRSRMQKNRHFRAISTDEPSVPPPHRQPTNRYDKTKVRDPGQQQQGSASTSSNHPAASSNDNKLFENETVLVDNDLYGGARCASPDPVAPSVPEENIYNEIHTLN